MKTLSLVRPGDHLTVLCIGAHSDDIEIGAGGALLSWQAAGASLDVHWCVGSASGRRLEEALCSARDFLHSASGRDFRCGGLNNGYFPYQGSDAKDWVESLKPIDPDIILTHSRDDADQDHRLLSELTRDAFRDHLILEYEIPKGDGEAGKPNFFVNLSESTLTTKIALLNKHFGSQQSCAWWDDDTFRGIARLRGMACNAPERFAEAFVERKAILG
jgi:LmbE family N-acetylglucosaminyl deacetylase